jgi:hypothetical protein
MDCPRYILEVGTVVRTHETLGDTRGFSVSPQNKAQRQANAVGVIGGYVPGHGGDVYWVHHGPDMPPGAYCFNEFEYDTTRVIWKLTHTRDGEPVTVEFTSLQEAWAAQKECRPVAQVKGPFIMTETLWDHLDQS